MTDYDLFRDFFGGDESSAGAMRDLSDSEQDDETDAFHDIDEEADFLLNEEDDDDDDDGEYVEYVDDGSEYDEEEDDDDDDDDGCYDNNDDNDDDSEDSHDDDNDDGEDNDDDGLSVSDRAINDLLTRTAGIEQTAKATRTQGIHFAGSKICATRHGCKGATNCDYAYGAPIGR